MLSSEISLEDNKKIVGMQTYQRAPRNSKIEKKQIKGEHL